MTASIHSKRFLSLLKSRMLTSSFWVVTYFMRTSLLESACTNAWSCSGSTPLETSWFFQSSVNNIVSSYNCIKNS